MKKKRIMAVTMAATLMFSGFTSMATVDADVSNSFTVSSYRQNKNQEEFIAQQQGQMQNMPMTNQPVQQPTGRTNNQQTIPGPIETTPINEPSTPNFQEPVDTQFSDVDMDIDDPGADYQWYLKATGSYLVWDSIADAQEDTVYVAVLDTGVDYNHDDLENRVDEDLGYDFVNEDDEAMDDNGHGTHVAGIIAAEADNGIGVSGVAGTVDVTIIPIKILDDDGYGESDDVVDGINYAVEQGADVINLSFGTSDLEDDEIEDIEEAIAEAIEEGVFVVAAAGNDSEDADDCIPASVDDVFTVASSGGNNLLSSFSNYGDVIEVMAPGESIVSTYLRNTYAEQDGTSMAAPIVSGIAAMMLAYDEDLDLEDLSDLLAGTANYLEAYDEQVFADDIGSGLIDAAGAYESLSDEDIYDEDDFVEVLESVTANPTDTAPENMAPSMNVRSGRQQVNNRR